ncbi:MAG: GNAT family N-acetyltransferase [Caldilineaceae bacterium]|nr:GNAT family N-acetyltransferase [Caldilineaceae bacterium]
MDKPYSPSMQELQRPTVGYTQAGQDDAPLLLSVILRAYAEFWGNLNPRSGAFAETAESIDSKLKKGGGIKAFAGAETVGTVLYERRPDFMYFGRLAVLPEWRRIGIAKGLIRGVEEQTAQAGLKRIQIGVRLVLASHQEYYAALGYRPIEYECHPGFTEPTSVTMEKVLV